MSLKKQNFKQMFKNVQNDKQKISTNVEQLFLNLKNAYHVKFQFQNSGDVLSL